MKVHKYHGLGNDYIVIDPAESILPEREDIIRLICDRNFGVGSDGILYGPLKGRSEPFVLRIFNPDGSEAEKSGNGLRIFSRYLWDAGMVSSEPFRISTKGGMVSSRVLGGGTLVRVEMGTVSFDAGDIPVLGVAGEVLKQELTVNGRTLTYCAATIGNPHCVIIGEKVAPETAKSLGPLIENAAIFPNRTNVQFLEVLDRARIRIEIWERGAGYTLASGSSSTASAAVAYRLGLCGSQVEVVMPGGTLQLEFSEDYAATMTGPVEAVFDGETRKELMEGKL